jgi:hypothetical protein
MAELASFTLKKRNPDVLTCIANLSNDEVFTPPEFANQMLDTLEKAWSDANNGASIWSNSNVKFLDPCTKSGVFLREIVERLTHGLENEIPDLQTRVNHILTKQIFGIGITHLTSLLARRSVYCSKFANGEHSVASSFDNADGNIWFESIKHTWVGGTQSIETADEHGNPIQRKVNGRCKYCGTNQSSLERSIESETHAYSFIHTEDVKNFITEVYGEEMQFDVIIGNPPYQLNDGGGLGGSAMPIYQLFVKQAKKLDPRFLLMVTPSRWFSGGRGLDDFRSEMLNDDRIRQIVDYVDSTQVFPGVSVKGGVSYFVWNRDNPGLASVTTMGGDGSVSVASRKLLEDGLDIFIRFNEAIEVIKKVVSTEMPNASTLSLPLERRFSSIVSSRKPFGLNSMFRGEPNHKKNDLVLYENGGTSFVSRGAVSAGLELIDSWKLFISFAYGAGEGFPHAILGKPILGKPGEVCTETYLVIGPFESEDHALNARSYIASRLFRFLVLQRKPSQNGTKKVYDMVPILDWSEPWSDKKLSDRYGVSEEECDFIESMIRPMELENE